MATQMSELVRRAGMFTNFISVLTEEIVTAGGFPEMIYFAQKEHARPLMKLLSETVVRSGLWRIPRSLMEKQSVDDPDCAEHDRRFCWAVYTKMGEQLTTHRYDDDEPEGYDGPIPEGLRQKIVGSPPRYPFLIEWEGELCVVTDLESSMGYEAWTPAELEKPITKVKRVFLAPAKYFDFES